MCNNKTAQAVFQHQLEPDRNGSRKDHVMATIALPSQEVLRQLLSYDEHTGLMMWRARPGITRGEKRWNTMYAGKPAFFTDCLGYKIGRLFGQNVRAHRILWVLHYGSNPDGVIDHINGCKSDNRIANLRVTDAGGNARNRPLRSDNSTGVCGVIPYFGRFRANIRFNGKLTHLGTFESFDAAVAARRAAERKMGFHKNHGRPA